MLYRPRHALVPEAYERRPYFRRLIKGARQELKFALRARHPAPPRKFMIFAQGRSGSTLLTAIIHEAPVLARGAMFEGPLLLDAHR
jgi:hypothetical protein